MTIIFDNRSVPVQLVDGVDEKVFESDVELRIFSATQKVAYVSALSNLCDASGCLVQIDGKYISSFDSVHLTVAASKYLVESIIDSLKIIN